MKVYHVDVKIEGLTFRLYFPSAQMRKLFCAMYRKNVAHCGRRPLDAAPHDLERTRMNLAFYKRFDAFLPVWDASIR